MKSVRWNTINVMKHDENKWKWEMKQKKDDEKGGMEHKKKVRNDEEK